MRSNLTFAGREFVYGGRTYVIINYGVWQRDYYARCVDRHYSADVFAADFVEEQVSCPLEVALLLGY